MKAHLFLIANRPGRLHPPPPQDEPAWAYVLSDSAHSECKPTPTEKLLKAHRIAAEVRKANPKMQVHRKETT